MLFLASKSPRRRELLKMLEIPFEILEAYIEVDEVYPESMQADEVPVYLSQLKAQAYKCLLKKDDILLTADTVVILDNRIIGKPKSENEACAMLSDLSGKTHTVVTGVTLTSIEKTESFSVHSRVTFAPLSREEINYYVSTFHPLDKAGAYGIQEWIGAAGVERIDGSFYNVMGLPVHRLYRALKNFN